MGVRIGEKPSERGAPAAAQDLDIETISLEPREKGGARGRDTLPGLPPAAADVAWYLSA